MLNRVFLHTLPDFPLFDVALLSFNERRPHKRESSISFASSVGVITATANSAALKRPRFDAAFF